MAATTKEQLIQYFATLDTSVLQKLQKYSKLLIIPEEDLLTDVTMIQMVEKAHSLADSLFPEWTDRSKSDFGEFLVELFAVFSEKDFWYINAFANEGVLRKMRSYSNAFSKVSSMGYQPVTCSGAKGNFSVTFEAGATTTYERGDLIISVGDIDFTNDEAFVVDKSSDEITMQLFLYEGKQISEDVTYNGHNIFIRKSNVDLSSVKVTIDNIIYDRVNNFGFSGIDSTHYMILPEEDGSCIIYFGSNGFGIQPALGKSVRLEYRTCNGTDGNITPASCEVNDSLDERKATKVVMLESSTGGNFSESLTSMKEKAPLYFYTKKAALNENVAEDILNSFSFVHKSKVIAYTSAQEIIYMIIPASGKEELSESELAQLKSEFEPYVVIGYRSTWQKNTYVNLLSRLPGGEVQTSEIPIDYKLQNNLTTNRLVIDAIVSPGYNVEAIKVQLIQIMEDITNPLISAEYGGSFVPSDVDILMRSKILGLRNVTFKVLYPGGRTELVGEVKLMPTEIFKKVNTELIDVNITVQK